MSQLRIACFSISIDGFGAGLQQSLEQPMGAGGMALHQWVLPTQFFQNMHGAGGEGTTGVDNDFALRGFDNIGAWILGRNMFGPIRGEWAESDWRGWWGDNPPYHTPVFVLTHHPREPLVMDGGTTFYFVSDGIESALAQAKAAANGMDVRLGGGVATVKKFLRAGLVDEMHIAVAPVLLGAGENLFADIDLAALGFYCAQHVATDNATHYIFKKK